MINKGVSNSIKSKWDRIFSKHRFKKCKKNTQRKNRMPRQRLKCKTNKKTQIYAQKDLFGYIQTHDDKEQWGNNPELKNDDTIRIGFQNIGMQQISCCTFNAMSTSQHIHNHPYDAFLIGEHGMNLTKIPPEDHWKERLPRYFTLLAYNKNEWHYLQG